MRVLSMLNTSRLLKSFCLLLFCALITYYHRSSIDVDKFDGRVLTPQNYLTFVMSIFVFSLYCVIEFNSLVNFAKVWIGIFIMESFSIFFALVSESYRMYVFEHFFYGDARFESGIEMGTRIIGIGICAANGSLIMSTACIILVLLKIKNQISDGYFYISYLIIFTATMFIGRTGMLVEIALFVYHLINSGISLVKVFKAGVGVSLVIALMTSLLSKVSPDTSEYLYMWITAAFDEETQLIVKDGIEKTGIPPITSDIIYGTGKSTGYVYEGVRYNADSGYIRSLIALGIFGFTAYYYAIWLFFRSPIINYQSSKIRYYVFFVIFLMFFVEYKEPFIMMMRFPWIIFVTSLFLAKEQHNMRSKVIKKME